MRTSFRILLSLSIWSIGTPSLKAQLFAPCGAVAGVSPTMIAQAMASSDQRDGLRYVKVKAVIAAIPDGNGGLLQAATVSRVQSDLDFTNMVFEQSGTDIQFQLCEAIEVVEDPSMYHAFTGDPTGFFAHRVPGYINIYYVQYMPIGLAGGHVLDLAMVASNGDVSTLAHEIGHILGLSHTFGMGIPELADGSNCTVAADMICDTPADPGLNQPGMVDVTTCTYTGTVTDANGDPYAPLLHNIMSASPCLRNSFTPDQGALMRYVLDEFSVQLLATTTPIDITPIPAVICANAPPLQLVGTPGPGTFTGPLVQGDQLNNHPNPPGSYSVTYTPDISPDGPFEMVDQFHVPNLWYTGTQLPLPTDSVRQTFSAARTGVFTTVDVRLQSSQPIEYRMRLYQGTGTALTLLHDTSTMETTADTVWVHFPVNEGVPCMEGTVYSFVITADASFTAIAPIGGYLAFGSNNLGPLNLMFRTWVRTNAPCQQVTRNYTLYQVPDRGIVNLPQALCHSDAVGVQLLPDPQDVTSSTTLVNGTVANEVVPSDLGIGEHIVQHIYTINGCTDTLTQVFTVEGPMAFVYPDVPAVICSNADPVVLQSVPALGGFRIDGSPATMLDPATLTLGPHQITHTYTAPLDTVAFADQICCPTGYALNTFLQDGAVNWQAFVPEQAGELESIRITLELFNVQRQLVVELHQGEGVSGAVLHTDTITASTHDGVLLTGTGSMMDPGATYTWSMRKVPDGNTGLEPMLGFTPGDHYPVGASAVSYWPDTIGELRFQEFIVQRFSCTDSTVLNVDVEICAAVDELGIGGFPVWPNPFSGVVQFEGNARVGSYAVIAADGREVLHGRALSSPTTSIDTSNLSSGGYVILLSDRDGAILGAYRLMKTTLD